MKNTGTLKVTTPTGREIVMTRVFDAPRRLVFDAFTKPELLKRWFGPRGCSLVVCEVDLKVGGVAGLAVSILGAAATWNKGPAFGPHWYPLALIVLAMPQAWAGGKLRAMQLRPRADA